MEQIDNSNLFIEYSDSVIESFDQRIRVFQQIKEEVTEASDIASKEDDGMVFEEFKDVFWVIKLAQEDIYGPKPDDGELKEIIRRRTKRHPNQSVSELMSSFLQWDRAALVDHQTEVAKQINLIQTWKTQIQEIDRLLVSAIANAKLCLRSHVGMLDYRIKKEVDNEDIKKERREIYKLYLDLAARQYTPYKAFRSLVTSRLLK